MWIYKKSKLKSFYNKINYFSKAQNLNCSYLQRRYGRLRNAGQVVQGRVGAELDFGEHEREFGAETAGKQHLAVQLLHTRKVCLYIFVVSVELEQ